jgi:DNA-binding NarL/FixJ family response regulator
MVTDAALLARAGDDAAARELLERMGPATTDEGTLAAARVHLLLGDLPTTAAIRASATPAVHVRGRVTTALLDTLLAAATGDEDRAIDRFEDALAAASWSLRRPFQAEAGTLRPLLERRIASGSAVREFALDLLERMSTGSPAPAEARRALIEPLTERESTVLRYLASTLSTAEIAAQLYVLVSTVKPTSGPSTASGAPVDGVTPSTGPGSSTSCERATTTPRESSGQDDDAPHSRAYHCEQAGGNRPARSGFGRSTDSDRDGGCRGPGNGFDQRLVAR